MLNFPYQKDARDNYFPVVDFLIYFKGNVQRTSALIDSGATVSVFKDDIAEQLGIVIEEGIETYLGGVGGRIKGYIHKLELEVAGKKFVCPVVFSYEYLVSFSLLGREAFFKQFKIVFEEKKNLLELA
ncbi:retropepsin-like domain-containing protein [Candidatus Parcubacteria bacterium]|nr:retropepsin-like domain-containing protein [Patescibacteria group bacterium]MBU4380797.1 retropepsin-like domain-containing protein [Patescibacteria group bacterium]MCG2689101.1 retropepsin-like domain-containing protein [Candidatus Parcubacteria bacterium]